MSSKCVHGRPANLSWVHAKHDGLCGDGTQHSYVIILNPPGPIFDVGLIFVFVSIVYHRVGRLSLYK